MDEGVWITAMEHVSTDGADWWTILAWPAVISYATGTDHKVVTVNGAIFTNT